MQQTISNKNTLHQNLKEQTTDAHVSLEKAMGANHFPITKKEDYVQLIKKVYGFIHPMEQLVYNIISEEHLPDIKERRLSNYLLEDLKKMNEDTQDLQEATSLPEINDLSSAFGALYVLEGSTLGGKSIIKMIKSTYGEDLPFTYYEGYKENTGKMWMNFLNVLHQQHQNIDEQKLITAANKTFQSFQTWLNQK